MKLRVEQQEAALNQIKESKLSKQERRLLEILEPYFEQQRMMNACMRDEYATLGDVLEENAAEHDSILSWLGFTPEYARQYHMLDERRDRIMNSDVRVIQVCYRIQYGDAIGNDILSIQRALDEEGIVTGIYSEHICDRLLEAGVAFPLDELPPLTAKDVIIFHPAVMNPFAARLPELDCKVILRYHNITPPEYFEPYDPNLAKRLAQGLQEIRDMRPYVDYAMTDSEFNKQDLINMGYQCEMSVVPVLIPFSDYDQEPAGDVIAGYQDEYQNILCIGRGAPNKKVEDVLDAYSTYKKRYNPHSRLFLVGRYNDDPYVRKLREKIQKEEIPDVVFTGHISFSEVLAYYRLSDLCICMSEHEGFCVPLLEAMYLHVPVLAYAAAAVPYTMGNAGILLQSKQADYVAKHMDRIMKSDLLRNAVLRRQRKRVAEMSYDTVKDRVLQSVQGVINSNPIVES